MVRSYQSGGRAYESAGRGLKQSLLTVLEDFEGSWPGDWTGATGDFSLSTATTIEGSQSLTASATDTIGNTNIAINRDGREYRARIRQDTDTSNGAAWIFQTQTSDPDTTSVLDNCYWYRLDTVNDQLTIYLRDAGATADSWVVSTPGLNTGEYYTMSHTPDGSGFTAAIEDSTGSELGSQTISDTTHGDGIIGIYSDEPDAYWDYLHVV